MTPQPNFPKVSSWSHRAGSCPGPAIIITLISLSTSFPHHHHHHHYPCCFTHFPCLLQHSHFPHHLPQFSLLPPLPTIDQTLLEPVSLGYISLPSTPDTQSPCQLDSTSPASSALPPTPTGMVDNSAAIVKPNGNSADLSTRNSQESHTEQVILKQKVFTLWHLWFGNCVGVQASYQLARLSFFHSVI